MFWDNFYNLCELKNTTPNAVCKELNLSTATATHWKNGTMPKGDVLFNIANLLDCSVDYLLGRTANPNGYSNKIVNNGKTTINDSGIQANVVNNSQLGKYSSNEMTEQLVMRFENLSFDDKLDVLNYINNKKNT